ncbi:MAG: PAS domain-containing protein [bacterium]|nr:PAS domain-containing protein [bacterium]
MLNPTRHYVRGLDYRKLAEAIPALIWLSDADGRVLYANRRWADFTGIEIADLEPRELGERLFHPDDVQRVRDAWHRVADGSGWIEIEYRLRTRDGGFRWVLASVVPLRDEGGRVVQWLGTAIDIDEQKRGADQMRAMMESVPEIVFTSHPSAGVDYYNKRWYDLTGQSESEALGVGWQQVIHPDDLAGLIAIWSQSKSSGAPYSAEYRIRAAVDGSYRWHTVTSRPILDENGAIVRWIGVATDIDDQKRREAHLQYLAEASESLAESFEVEQRLVHVATLAVPEIADWCGIYLLRADETFDPVAVAHGDADRLHLAHEIMRRYPPHMTPAAREMFRTGRSSLLRVVPDEALARAAVDDAHLALMRELQMRSMIQVPLVANDQHFGIVQIVNGTSGRIFDEQDLQLVEILAKRISVALDNARVYERERRVASTFQHAALPRALPEIPGLSLSAVYNPAESEAEIGGDWYDAFLVGDDHLIVSIGDVSGKGLEAAVLMGTIRQSIRVAALEGFDCARVVRAADKALQLEYPGHVASALVMAIDLRTRTCRYVNAGHPPALVRCGDASVCELQHTNLPLGIAPTRDDEIGEIVLDEDCLLLCYTDGLIEATRDVLEGGARLREVLASEAMLHTPNPARLVHDTVLDCGARDDVAILAITFGRSRHWSFDARDANRAQGARSSFVRHLREEGSEDSDYAGAEVIFGELTGNVVRYSPGPIDIDLEWSDEQPILHVLDRGARFALKPTLPEDVLSENGRGLFIVRTLGDDLRVRPLPGRGNHVRVRLPVRRRR